MRGDNKMNEIKSTIEHYEILIDDGNDPYHDNEVLQEYMNRWTGNDFLNLLNVNKEKRILEVGVGTGRLAKRVLDVGCFEYVGIDISPSTIQRAKQNLANFNNVEIINENIIDFNEKEVFDIVFSVLTFQHILDKREAIKRMVGAVKPKGSIVLSLDNINGEYIEYGSHKVNIYPNNVQEIISYMNEFDCDIEVVREICEKEKLVATLVKSIKKEII